MWYVLDYIGDMGKENDYLRMRALELKADVEPTPTDEIVVTGYAALTPFGDAKATYEALLNGESSIKKYAASNDTANIASPINFNPSEHFDRRELRGISQVSAMALYVSMEAMKRAGLTDENGKLKDSIDRRRLASWVASGIASAPDIIEANDVLYSGLNKNDVMINEIDEKTETKMRKNSRRISPFLGLEVFPEGIAGNIAIKFGAQGWGGGSVEACATGLSSIVDGAEKIRSGRADIVIAGGCEDILSDPKNIGTGKIGIGLFGKMGVLSRYNDEPDKASRPFDRDRQGFVMGAGAAIVVMESRAHAERRGANILAKVGGFSKSMDGGNPTEIDIDNVSRTCAQALYDIHTKKFVRPDVFWAHATSTMVGDGREAWMLRNLLGDELMSETPVAAIKSNMGHLFGAAGAINAVSSIQSFEYNLVPHIRNLDNPQMHIGDLEKLDEKEKMLNEGIENLLQPIRKTPYSGVNYNNLVVAYGFHGYNSAMMFQRP